MRDKRRRSDDPIMVAAVGLIESLAADEQFVKSVTETEIQARIDAGELIPAERLQVAPGLTLVTVGRVEALESMIGQLLEATAAAGGVSDGLLADAAGLLTTSAEPESDDDGEDEQAPDDEAEPAPEPEPKRGRARRELPAEPLPCAVCGTTDLTEENTHEANVEQTGFAMMRFRRPLCRPCMADQ